MQVTEKPLIGDLDMITLLGAAPDTGNQGVSALCRSAVAGIRSRGFDRIAVADHGRGARRAFWWIGGEETGVDLFGLTNNRRLWRGDCLRTVSALARLGGLGNSAARSILGSRAVLDVSGGDSFTDLYGEKVEAPRYARPAVTPRTDNWKVRNL